MGRYQQNFVLISSGRNPKKIWEQIEDAIREVCLSKEPMIMKYLSTYKSKRNFFEMMRFDFVVDDNLNVFVMEVSLPDCLPPHQIIDALGGFWSAKIPLLTQLLNS